MAALSPYDGSMLHLTNTINLGVTVVVGDGGVKGVGGGRVKGGGSQGVG